MQHIDTVGIPLEEAKILIDSIQNKMDDMSQEDCLAFIHCVLSGLAFNLIEGEVDHASPTMAPYVEAVNTAKTVTLYMQGESCGNG
jgi:hypothetical protein